MCWFFISYVLLIKWSPRKRGIKKHICRFQRICTGQICSFPSSKYTEISKQAQAIPAGVMVLCYTYPTRKMSCLHSVGCLIVVSMGHGWAAWQRCVGVALEYQCDLEVRSEKAGRFWSVTGFDIKYLCERGMFLVQWSHQHSQQIHGITVSPSIAKMQYQTNKGVYYSQLCLLLSLSKSLLPLYLC